jgi:hypothetical protein
MKEHQSCVICNHETPRIACARCQNRIARHLTDIVEYTALAAGELLPGQGGDGRSNERSIGIRIEALDLIAGNDVLPILESWERMFRDEWGYAPWGPTTLGRGQGQADQATAYLTGTVAFLRGNLEKICGHPAVDDFAAEVTTCWHQARNAARRQPRQAWRVTCPADTDTGECGTWLRVTGQDFGQEISCRKCRTTWPTERLLMVVATSTEADLWIDTEAATRHTGVPEASLRRYAKQGKIKRQGSLYEYKSLTTVMRAKA